MLRPKKGEVLPPPRRCAWDDLPLPSPCRIRQRLGGPPLASFSPLASLLANSFLFDFELHPSYAISLLPSPSPFSPLPKQSYFRQGFMTEAVLALLHFLLDVLRVSTVTIEPLVQDNGSLSLARKVGAVRAPRKSDETNGAKVMADKLALACFAITRERWYARRENAAELVYDPTDKT